METCQTVNPSRITISKDIVKNIADNLAEEMATKMYYTLMMVKFIPEIKAVESGKMRALKGKEVDKFLKGLKN